MAAGTTTLSRATIMAAGTTTLSQATTTAATAAATDLLSQPQVQDATRPSRAQSRIPAARAGLCLR
jgi:hypothetical protein